MSSGLPIVASDLPVHREICEDAAVYFPRFSPEKLANCVLQIHEDRGLAGKLSEVGRVRSRDFSWEEHVSGLLALADGLVGRASGASRAREYEE